MTIFLLSFWHEPSLPQFAGPVRVWELAKALAGLGHRVHVFVPWYPGVRDVPTVTVHRVPVLDVGMLRALSFYVMSALAILWWTLRRPPAMIYMRTMANPLPLFIARLRRTRFFLEVNDDIFQARLRRALSPAWGRAVELAERVNCRGADIIIVEVEEMAQKLAVNWQVRRDRVVCLPGGTDATLFRPLRANECRAALGLPEVPWVGFVGTLYGYQGLHTLVGAAALIRAGFPDVRFLIVGSGEMEAELRESVRVRGLADRFHFTGWVPYADLPQCIGAMEICVAPLTADRGDAIPMKVFDYMACGRPIVIGARRESLQIWSGWPGVVYVEPEDPVALARGVSELLGDAELRSRLGVANRRVVEERYSWGEIARRIMALREACG